MSVIDIENLASGKNFNQCMGVSDILLKKMLKRRVFGAERGNGTIRTVYNAIRKMRGYRFCKNFEAFQQEFVRICSKFIEHSSLYAAANRKDIRHAETIAYNDLINLLA